MVHPLGGLRGPDRTMAAFASQVANVCELDVAAAGGVILTSVEELPQVGSLQLPLQRSRVRSWLKGSRALSGYIARGCVPDVIHANGLSALNLIAPIALRRSIPVLVHFHGSEIGYRARVLAKLWMQLGVRLELHPVSTRAKAVLVDAGLGPMTEEILPNPIEVPSHSVLPRNDLPMRIGFVGSGSRRKGLHIVVDVARQMADDNVEWVIFGVKPDSSSAYVRSCIDRLVAAGLRDRIEWRGVVDDVETAYREMDVLLIPSLQESWCRVAMEGMALALPVVSADIPGLRELTGRVPGALTFPVHRPDVAAVHLRALVDDVDLRRSLGTAGREAMRAFDIGVVMPQLLRFYERLLEASAPSDVGWAC